MGRPRKQPRRIVTFNLNADLAQRIDDLNLSNRSEWANGVFREVMDDRLARRQGQQLEDIAKAEEAAADARTEAIVADPLLAIRLAIRALEDANAGDYRPVGRYPLVDLLKRSFVDLSDSGDRGF